MILKLIHALYNSNTNLVAFVYRLYWFNCIYWRAVFHVPPECPGHVQNKLIQKFIHIYTREVRYKMTTSD